MTQITANGHTYSDDGSAAMDMGSGGHRAHLLPMLGDVMVEVSIATAAAADASGSAAASAAYAIEAQNYAAALQSTSATSILIGTGSKTLTTQTGKQYAAGQWVTATSAANSANQMFGQVASYSGSTLIVNVSSVTGSGTFADWNISIAGTRGPAMTGGAPMQRSARTSNTAIAYADMGSLIDITSGTFSQTFVAAATLGAGWWCCVRNNGTGDITLDPNASESIDGATTSLLSPGMVVFVQCDGSALRSVVMNPGSGGYFCARDEKPSGTGGGSSAATTWETRTLNTVVKNTIVGASLASSNITLPAGSYRFEVKFPVSSGPTYGRGGVYNNTDAAFVILGSVFSAPGHVSISGNVTIPSQKTFSVRQYTAAACEFGMAYAALGLVEIYATVEIWRLA